MVSFFLWMCITLALTCVAGVYWEIRLLSLRGIQCCGRHSVAQHVDCHDVPILRQYPGKPHVPMHPERTLETNGAFLPPRVPAVCATTNQVFGPCPRCCVTLKLLSTAKIWHLGEKKLLTWAKKPQKMRSLSVCLKKEHIFVRKLRSVLSRADHPLDFFWLWTHFSESHLSLKTWNFCPLFAYGWAVLLDSSFALFTRPLWSVQDFCFGKRSFLAMGRFSFEYSDGRFFRRERTQDKWCERAHVHIFLFAVWHSLAVYFQSLVVVNWTLICKVVWINRVCSSYQYISVGV